MSKCLPKSLCSNWELPVAVALAVVVVVVEPGAGAGAAAGDDVAPKKPLPRGQLPATPL